MIFCNCHTFNVSWTLAGNHYGHSVCGSKFPGLETKFPYRSRLLAIYHNIIPFFQYAGYLVHCTYIRVELSDLAIVVCELCANGAGEATGYSPALLQLLRQALYTVVHVPQLHQWFHQLWLSDTRLSHNKHIVISSTGFPWLENLSNNVLSILSTAGPLTLRKCLTGSTWCNGRAV